MWGEEVVGGSYQQGKTSQENVTPELSYLPRITSVSSKKYLLHWPPRTLFV